MSARFQLIPAVTACAALLAATNGVCAAQAAATPAQIGAHAAHYVFEGRAYTDLDALEAAVRASGPAALELHSCTANGARAWTSAVPRFADIRLYLEFADGTSGVCAPVPVALPAGGRSGALPSGIDDVAVARYWEQVAP